MSYVKLGDKQLFIYWLTCKDALLYKQVYRPDQAPELSSSQQGVMGQGTLGPVAEQATLSPTAGQA